MAMLPKFRKFEKNSLRPNPAVANGERGALAFSQGPVLDGDFGDESAAVRPAVSINKAPRSTPKGKKDETKFGWP